MKALGIALIAVLVMIFVAMWIERAHAEDIHYVRMQFTDEFDLGAKTQAFIAESDTTYYQGQVDDWRIVSNVERGDTLTYAQYRYYKFTPSADTAFGSVMVTYYRLIVRQLIGVTAIPRLEVVCDTIKHGEDIIVEPDSCVWNGQHWVTYYRTGLYPSATYRSNGCYGAETFYAPFSIENCRDTLIIEALIWYREEER